MKRNLSVLSVLALFIPEMVVAANVNNEYRAFNTPVNHNYHEAFVGAGSIDPDAEGLGNEDLTELGIGYHRMINPDWIIDVDIRTRFAHGDISDLRNDRAIIGTRYRLGVSEYSDMTAGAKIGVARSKAKDKDTENTLYSETDFMYGINLGYYYGFTQKIDGGVKVEYLDADHFDETIFGAELTYYKTERLGFGGYLSHVLSNNSDSVEAGITVRFRFNH